MVKELERKLKNYIDKFNRDDNEYYKQDIDNANSMEWLKENIPVIDIPDKTIEEIYYFRWWVFRKHIRNTEDGYVITEFLPPVPWAGKHNTIVAAAGHHVSEAKWLKCGEKVTKDYLKFWFDEKSNTYLYSSWIIYSAYELCKHTGDFSFGIENLDLFINYYEKMEAEHKTECGLFWSIDNNDGMEFSISGVSEEMEKQEGIRPTLNSYMAANAYAVKEFAKMAGREDVIELYEKKYIELKEKMTDILWDGEFYKAIHTPKNFKNPKIKDLLPSRNAKELLGYIPWCFNLAPEGFEKAFYELKKEDGFKCEYGLTTAEQRHPRFLYEAKHECFWNGYIWPFATTQVLNAVLNLLDNYNQDVIDKDDFYDILNTYAKSHYMTNEKGDKICFIDEMKHPKTDIWQTREILKEWGWKKELGGFERGKDYNHSAFCDIVLKGILGVKIKNEEIFTEPKIPDDWEYFMIENLWVKDNCYKIIYDKTGEHYKQGKGIKIIKE